MTCWARTRTAWPSTPPACGVDVQFELYPVTTHDFHVFWSFLPEAADALEQAGAFVRRVRARSVERPAGER